MESLPKSGVKRSCFGKRRQADLLKSECPRSQASTQSSAETQGSMNFNPARRHGSGSLAASGRLRESQHQPTSRSTPLILRGTWCIIAYQAYAACLRGRLNSNVRPHQNRTLRTTRQNSRERNPRAWKGASFSLKGCSRRRGSIFDFPASDWWT